MAASGRGGDDRGGGIRASIRREGASVLVVGLLCALVAAGLNSAAGLLEAAGGRRVHRAGGVVSQPLYLLGLAVDVLGFLLTVVALRFARRLRGAGRAGELDRDHGARRPPPLRHAAAHGRQGGHGRVRRRPRRRRRERRWRRTRRGPGRRGADPVARGARARSRDRAGLAQPQRRGGSRAGGSRVRRGGAGRAGGPPAHDADRGPGHAAIGACGVRGRRLRRGRDRRVHRARWPAAPWPP